MTKLCNFLLVLISANLTFAQSSTTQMNMNVSLEEANLINRMRQNGGVNASSTGTGGIGGMSGCFQGMLQATSQGQQNTLEAQKQEAEGLMALSEKYLENEQKCGNDLAELKTQMDQARAEHEDKLLELPYLIEDQKLEYRESLLALQQECEQSSGAAFQEWKQMVGTGVVTPERGGPMALFSRGRNINSFQKIFEMDCLGSKNNVERSHILAQRLANNIAKQQNAVDRSAQKLAALSKSLSFKQGVTVKNCMRAEAQLDYQSEITRQLASATRSATQSQNFMGMMGAVSSCIEGAANAIDVTGAGANTNTTN